MPFLRRLALAPVVFLAVAAVTYAMPRVLRPDAYPAMVGYCAPVYFVGLTNLVLVERILNMPGFLRYTWRAAGHANFDDEAIPDFALLCALALWGAALLIALGLIADGIVSRLDPRVRLSGGQAW